MLVSKVYCYLVLKKSTLMLSLVVISLLIQFTNSLEKGTFLKRLMECQLSGFRYKQCGHYFIRNGKRFLAIIKDCAKNKKMIFWIILHLWCVKDLLKLLALINWKGPLKLENKLTLSFLILILNKKLMKRKFIIDTQKYAFTKVKLWKAKSFILFYVVLKYIVTKIKTF